MFEIPALGLTIYLDKPRAHQELGIDLAKRMALMIGGVLTGPKPYRPERLKDAVTGPAWDPVERAYTDTINPKNVPLSLIARLLHAEGSEGIELVPQDLNNFGVSTYDEVSWFWEAQLKEDGLSLPFAFGLFDTDFFSTGPDDDLTLAVLALVFGFECSLEDEDEFPFTSHITAALSHMPDARQQLRYDLMHLFMAFAHADHALWCTLNFVDRVLLSVVVMVKVGFNTASRIKQGLQRIWLK